MGTNITLTADDGATISAYEARPVGTPKGGVVVIQEVFGVNSHIRSVADFYADNGYLAVAPAMFDRVEKGVELGYGPEDIQAGIGFVRGKVDMATVMTDVAAAAAHAATAGKVGVVGYCWGGMLTTMSSIKLGGVVHACASYYGGGNVSLIGQQPVVPLLMHFGENDHGIPLADVEKMGDAWPDATIHVYEGAEHGFNCEQRASYNAEAAALANERTLEFFTAHLRA